MKGWRTIVANGFMSIMPILELTELTDVMPAEWLPWYALGMALINMFLRSVTTTPMGRKE